ALLRKRRSVERTGDAKCAVERPRITGLLLPRTSDCGPMASSAIPPFFGPSVWSAGTALARTSARWEFVQRLYEEFLAARVSTSGLAKRSKPLVLVALYRRR